MPPRTHSIVEIPGGGDRRSIGRANQVVAQVLRNPARFGDVVAAMQNTDVLVRMRAADAAEKITLKRPDLLQPHKRRLLSEIARDPQQEVRWHVAQMLPRLKLTLRERVRAVAVLRGYLKDESRIVKTFAMQALADLANQDEKLRKTIVPLLRRLMQTRSPAMQSRGRRLLKQLNRLQP